MSLNTPPNSDSRPIFTYKPLREPDAIRLILLHPAADVTADLECSLEHATLSRYNQDLINQYTALSYVWGDCTKEREIIMDDCSFHITANLDSALRNIRDDQSIIKIWADAICINQEDTEERNKQVQQMGSVYSTARHTIIYLGESCQESDNLFIQLDDLRYANRFPFTAGTLYSNYDCTQVKSLCNAIQKHIGDKTWFTRVWIFQELMLSRDPWVQCGTKRIRWEDLCQLCLSAINWLRDPEEESQDFISKSPGFLSDISTTVVPKEYGTLERIKSMHIARQKFENFTRGNGEGNTLFDLLKERRGLGVTDARDMIYGHLGIATDSLVGQLGIEVDYNKNCSDLFADVMWYFIELCGDLEILRLVEDFGLENRRTDLPSWVPDWTSKRIQDYPRDPPYSLQDLGYEYKRRYSVSGSVSQDGKRQLHCTGRIISVIEKVGSNILHFEHLTEEEIDTAWSRYFENPPIVRGRWEGNFKLNTCYRELLAGFIEAAGLGETGTWIFDPMHWKWLNWITNLRTIADAMYLSGAMEEERQHSNFPFHPFALLAYGSPYVFSHERNGNWDVVDNFGREKYMLRILEGRRLCLYKDKEQVAFGRSGIFDAIGLVPRTTEVGDLICEIEGYSRCCVLRQLLRTKRIEGESILCVCIGMCANYPYRFTGRMTRSNARFTLQ